MAAGYGHLVEGQTDWLEVVGFLGHHNTGIVGPGGMGTMRVGIRDQCAPLLEEGDASTGVADTGYRLEGLCIGQVQISFGQHSHQNVDGSRPLHNGPTGQAAGGQYEYHNCADQLQGICFQEGTCARERMGQGQGQRPSWAQAGAHVRADEGPLMRMADGLEGGYGQAAFPHPL